MDNDLLRDLPKIKNMLNELKTLKSIKEVLPLFLPFLKSLGIDDQKIHHLNNALNFGELEATLDDLITIPDRFNDLFASRGWIMYDLMSIPVAKAAIKQAEGGNFDSAEDTLVEYYNAQTVRLFLNTMNAVEKFRPRIDLARKAVRDYEEGRYYASTLVVLSLIDGLTSEMSSNQRGFASQEVDMRAWDSWAAHSKGLNVLAGVFKTGRRTLHTEEITIPYRNGIMHGMDVGYDNKIVAAKTWAALFAVREWALKVQHGEVEAPPESPIPTFMDNIHGIQEAVASRAMMDAWQPRELSFGVHIPRSGEPKEYEEGSPEQVLVDFLTAWKKKNYGRMAQHLSYSHKKFHGKALPKKIRDYYAPKKLQSYELLNFLADDVNVAIIKIKVLYEQDEEIMEHTKDINIRYDNEAGNPSVRGKKGGHWAFHDWYL